MHAHSFQIEICADFVQMISVQKLKFSTCTDSVERFCCQIPEIKICTDSLQQFFTCSLYLQLYVRIAIRNFCTEKCHYFLQ